MRFHRSNIVSQRTLDDVLRHFLLPQLERELLMESGGQKSRKSEHPIRHRTTLHNKYLSWVRKYKLIWESRGGRRGLTWKIRESKQSVLWEQYITWRQVERERRREWQLKGERKGEREKRDKNEIKRIRGYVPKWFIVLLSLCNILELDQFEVLTNVWPQK